jgi:hypothetical protein
MQTPNRRRVSCRGRVLVCRAGLFAVAVAATSSTCAIATAANNPLFKFGPIGLRPQLQYTGSYSEGALVRPGQPESSYVDTFSPGLQIDLREKWKLAYTAAFIRYSNQAFQDTLNHTASLDGAVNIGPGAITFLQGYSSSSSLQLETGRQTGLETVTTSVGAAYPIGPKVALLVSGNQGLTFVEAAPDSGTWETTESISYKLSPRVDVSSGVSVGYSAVYKSPDMFVVRPLIKISWKPSDKLTASVQASLTEQKFLGGKETWLETPTFEASADYKPFEYTTLTATGTRTVAPSTFLKNQVLVRTAGTLTVTQRLLGHLNANANVTGGESAYVSSVPTAERERKDYPVSYRIGIGSKLLTRGNAEIFYMEAYNFSNRRGFGFSNRQIGLTVGYRY